MIRVSFLEMQATLERVLISRGVQADRATLASRLIAETSLDGVYTHGAHRFYPLIKQIDEGIVDPEATASLVSAHGALERWDGNSGIGNLNAYAMTERAIALAKEHTIGVVALRNTNHWMRPGTYGLMAAEAGCIGILWTNTMPLMAPWGSEETKVGNNPLVIALPTEEEGPFLVDMAMSLFSYGTLETHVREGKPLPEVGGWDSEGVLTTDAAAIMESRRSLPIGFWKGTSLAIALDLVAAALSGGNTTYDIGQLGVERTASQVFITIDISAFSDYAEIQRRIGVSLADIEASEPLVAGDQVRWPGKRRAAVRAENLANGIPTSKKIWEKILTL